ncbi:MAG: L-threonylcarbamoyladenylate synthase [Sandaracinaceae bacterium]
MRALDVDAAADELARGGLVAFPTETVYGLGADASRPDAVRRVFRVKGRPADHPLIVHLARPADLDAWARGIPPFAHRLADLFMPGPLTLILPRAAHVGDVVTGGRDTVGLRVPAHPLALDLIAALSRKTGRAAGIAAPSANRFGSVSPTSADHVRADLAGEDVGLLDGGPCAIGVESTIVDCASPTGPAILRVGGLPREEIEAALDAPVPLATDGPARAPGMLAAHYAPRARVIAKEASALAEACRAARARGERVACWSVDAPDDVDVHVPAPLDDRERARTLYATLRALDARGVDTIVVELPEQRGLGSAIADRLRRAARARPV